MSEFPLQTDRDCDPQMVEALITGAQNGISRAYIPHVTTTSELLTAVFTLLDRTLRAVRTHQTSKQRFDTAAHISGTLNEMLIDHGKVPN